MDNFGSGGRKKSFIISHSGKFKSKNKKRISITDEIWIGPERTKLDDSKPPLDQTSRHELSINNAIADKKLLSDKNTEGNQAKADYKCAENAS